MTDDQLLAATRGRLMADLDVYFPMKKAPSASTPEAFGTHTNPPAREEQAERNEY